MVHGQPGEMGLRRIWGTKKSDEGQVFAAAIIDEQDRRRVIVYGLADTMHFAKWIGISLNKWHDEKGLEAGDHPQSRAPCEPFDSRRHGYNDQQNTEQCYSVQTIALRSRFCIPKVGPSHCRGQH